MDESLTKLPVAFAVGAFPGQAPAVGALGEGDGEFDGFETGESDGTAEGDGVVVGVFDGPAGTVAVGGEAEPGTAVPPCAASPDGAVPEPDATKAATIAVSAIVSTAARSAERVAPGWDLMAELYADRPLSG